MKLVFSTLLLLGFALLPVPTLASTHPSSLTLRWGFDEGGWSQQPQYSNVPALSATWPLARKVSLWSGASYFQQSTRFSNLRFIGAREHSYSRYLPLSFGLRILWNAPHFDWTPMERKMTLKEGPWVNFHGRLMGGACSRPSSSGRRFSAC